MEALVFHPFDALVWLRTFRKIRHELGTMVVTGNRQQAGSNADLLSDAYAGKINFPDAYILKCLLHRYRPAQILEVGSFVGFSTRWLLEVSSEWGAEVTAVDPNIRHRRFEAPAEILRRLNAKYIPDRLEVVEAFFGSPGSCYYDYETFEPKRSKDYVDQLVAGRQQIHADWNRNFDLIFIDGDHNYEAVMENFRTAVGFLNDGGCIVFHDAISWEGVRNALTSIACEFSGRAKVTIIGKLDQLIFQGIFGKSSSGIGVFRLT